VNGEHTRESVVTGQASATDLYALLGVPSDADADAIKTAYRRRARALHPDRNPDDPDADEKFSAVREAYEVLSDTARRHEYDQRRRRPRTPPVARPAPAAPRPAYPAHGRPADGRRLEFDVAARPPSTPDLSALDRWSCGVGTATAAAVVAVVVLALLAVTVREVVPNGTWFGG
jgi:curved DNA-binding protein CbpA